MNKNLNEQDIQKFTKYCLKLNALVGGGNSQKRNIYNEKYNEYSNKLKRSGVNVAELERSIQNGGGKFLDDMKRQKAKIEAKIQDIKPPDSGNDRKLENAAQEINAKMVALKASHGKLADAYTHSYMDQLQLTDQVAEEQKKNIEYVADLKGAQQILTDLMSGATSQADTVKATNVAVELPQVIKDMQNNEGEYKPVGDDVLSNIQAQVQQMANDVKRRRETANDIDADNFVKPQDQDQHQAIPFDNVDGNGDGDVQDTI